MREEYGWTQDRVRTFTNMVNVLLSSEYREDVIKVILEEARNIRVSRNLATIAMLKARQK